MRKEREVRIESGMTIYHEPISKSVFAYALSFSQAKRVGNPSENKERFSPRRVAVATGQDIMY
jgi:hypothetical protein